MYFICKKFADLCHSWVRTLDYLLLQMAVTLNGTCVQVLLLNY